MHYIRQKQVIQEVANQEITDPKQLRELLEQLSQGSIDMKIEYTDPKTQYISRYPRIRVKKVHPDEDKIDIIALMQKAHCKIYNIPFENLISILLVAETDNIILNSQNITRFDFIEIASDNKE